MDGEKKNSVLIVDDDKTNIMALTHILSNDYTIQAARNGYNAIKAAEQRLPDVILLDVIMPDMDGYTVIRVLKNSEKTRDIPVIFITGLNDAESEEKGLVLGAADYISKPFNPAIVMLRVRNQIQMLNYVHTIERLTLTDQLTGIPNRRSFDNRMNIEWRHAIRGKTPISVLIMDIDGFKAYNDTFGHQQGDVALQTVAKTLEETLRRSNDFVARWGGEEFIALLPGTDLNGAMNIAEILRSNIENTVIPLSDGTESRETISVGINTLTPEQDSVIDSFISGADNALYTAKETGRNKVCVCQL
jgi:diguanylate cyclase (GGDEF)-like protein